MGIGIDVNGLVDVSKGERTSIAKAGWNFVADICKTMGWQEIPWHEPAGEGGLATSRGSRYFSYLDRLVYTAEFVLSPLEEGELNRPQNKFQNFSQIYDRDEYWAIYVPFDLPGPIGHSDSESNTSFTVGSAVRLGQELEKLTPFISEESIKKVFQTDEGDTLKILEMETDLVEILQRGIADSLHLNLPLQIRW